MIINLQVNDTYSAGQEWLRRTLEKEECTLPDYPRPTKIIKRSLFEMTETALVAFGRQVVKGSYNIFFNI
jgi:hypothetical protein